MPLTDTAIRNAKPGAKPKKLADGFGMYLEISPAGGRYWRIKFRVAGKEKRLSLGGRVTVNGKSYDEFKTSDPGQALITGQCKDLGKFKVPRLRGLAARAP